MSSTFGQRWTPILGEQGYQVIIASGGDLLINALNFPMPVGVVGARISPIGRALEYSLSNFTAAAFQLLPENAVLDLTNAEQVKNLFMNNGSDLAVQFFGGTAGSRR